MYSDAERDSFVLLTEQNQQSSSSQLFAISVAIEHNSICLNVLQIHGFQFIIN